MQYAGNQTLDLKQLFAADELGDICWVQFMSTTGTEARRLRRNSPDVVMLAPDPDEDNNNMDPRDDMSVYSYDSQT